MPCIIRSPAMRRKVRLAQYSGYTRAQLVWRQIPRRFASWSGLVSKLDPLPMLGWAPPRMGKLQQGAILTLLAGIVLIRHFQFVILWNASTKNETRGRAMAYAAKGER